MVCASGTSLSRPMEVELSHCQSAKCRNLAHNIVGHQHDIRLVRTKMVESAAAFVRMGLINQSQADELQRIGQSIEKRADELGGSYEVQFAQELYARRTTYFPEEAIDALLAATGGLRPGFRDVYLGDGKLEGRGVSVRSTAHAAEDEASDSAG